jgi:YegS/Rv2252/BmrU family lipid kinase
MKKKICFIVNPISGVGRQRIIEKLVEQKLDHNRFEHRILYTEHAKHAVDLCRSSVDDCYDIVVAVGGDGSVNEVGSALIGSNSALAIMPTGSGNGLARHLRIPMNLVKAMDVINNGKEIVIDTVNINNDVFLGMAGVGFDAHIGWEFAQYGKRGFSSYVKVITREFPKYKAMDYELEIDGKKYERNAFLISFANGSQYGNNAVISPGASLQDGMLDVCILKDFPMYALPVLAFRLFNRSMDHSKYVEIIRGKKIKVKQLATTAHLDGEPVELGNEINIEVKPGSLKVIV